MSMGTYDAEEFERREKMISSVETESDDRRIDFEGRVEYTGDDSIEELLSRLKELREERD
ncbi:DUF5786 family protein [Natronococcus wangiae]|uniref:DUF5786 family protein n=1 Tax=Natronococcus wangiae TaxID=3068275 RepID=UPI00273F0236|nr:DUF5786 family protein [Natronococcus sp. AD5]